MGKIDTLEWDMWYIPPPIDDYLEILVLIGLVDLIVLFVIAVLRLVFNIVVAETKPFINHLFPTLNAFSVLLLKDIKSSMVRLNLDT